MTQFLIVLPLAFASVFCTIPLQNNSNYLDKQVADCLLQIAESHFHPDMPVFIQLATDKTLASKNYFFNTSGENALKSFVQSFKYTIINFGIIYSDMAKEYVNLKPGSVLLILPNLRLLDQILFTVKQYLTRIRQTFGNRNIRIAVVITNVITSKENKERLALSVLNTVWFYQKMSDVIVLIPAAVKSPENEKMSVIDIYSWLPETQFNEKGTVCLIEITDVQQFDRWISNEKRFLKNTNLFPKKQPRKMNNCYLDVETTIYPPFGGFPNLVMKHENPDLVNGLYVGIMKVLREMTQIEFMTRISRKTNWKILCPIRANVSGKMAISIPECTLTRSHFLVSIYWYISVSPVPQWQGIIRVFSTPVWALVTAAYIMGCVIFWLRGSYQNSAQGFLDAFLDVFRSYLAQSISQNFTGIISATFFILWLFFCIQIYTSYQTALTGFLIDPGDFTPIKSLEELAVKNIDLYRGLQLNEDLNYKFCDFIECFNILTNKENVGVLGNSFIFDVFSRFSPKRYGRKRMYKLDIKFMEFPIMCAVHLGCMFTEQLNFVTESLLTAGILDKWLSGIMNQIERENINYENDGAIPLSLVNLQGPFYILIVGLVFASVGFISEFVFKYLI
ncbi:Ionotropic receptor 553 [Blattella germanica]|nr:Ionotropic receptor 553 [Blattella germanica]